MAKGYKDYTKRINDKMFEVVEMSGTDGYDNILFTTLEDAREYARNLDAIPKNYTGCEIWISEMFYDEGMGEYTGTGDVLEVVEYERY